MRRSTSPGPSRTSGTPSTTGRAAVTNWPRSSPTASTRCHGPARIGARPSNTSRGAAALSLLSAIIESAPVYRLWQAPYVEQKLAPIRRHNDLARARRVLDIGCGPGTNTRAFLHAAYVGL